MRRIEANLMARSQKLTTLSAEALGLDEFETLTREKAYLADAFGVPVEIYSADKAGEDPKGKSKQAEPGRPVIYIDYIIETYSAGPFVSGSALNLHWRILQ